MNTPKYDIVEPPSQDDPNEEENLCEAYERTIMCGGTTPTAFLLEDNTYIYLPSIFVKEKKGDPEELYIETMREYHQLITLHRATEESSSHA